jgi:hypothetical protein
MMVKDNGTLADTTILSPSIAGVVTAGTK